MNIGITGASGFVGQAVVDLALRRGHEVIAFSRHPERKIPGCDMRPFSLDHAPDLSGCEAVVHLAGESVQGLWTSGKRRRIRDSRVLGTRRVVEGILAARQRPEVLVSYSGIGIYAPHPEAELDESAPFGTTFLAEVSREWEAEAAKAEGVRVVLMRTSLVLGRGGGALGVMRPIFRAGLGGILGDGRQWQPWIHLADQAMLTLFAIENLEARGPINAAAPWPVRNRELTRALAKALRRPAWLRVPAWSLRLALGGFAHELLDSKRVVPGAATALGFQFKYPELEAALRELLA
jgi:uncharacterized protein (TIGR01777 family)